MWLHVCRGLEVRERERNSSLQIYRGSWWWCFQDAAFRVVEGMVAIKKKVFLIWLISFIDMVKHEVAASGNGRLSIPSRLVSFWRSLLQPFYYICICLLTAEGLATTGSSIKAYHHPHHFILLALCRPGPTIGQGMERRLYMQNILMEVPIAVTGIQRACWAHCKQGVDCPRREEEEYVGVGRQVRDLQKEDLKHKWKKGNGMHVLSPLHLGTLVVNKQEVQFMYCLTMELVLGLWVESPRDFPSRNSCSS